MKIQSKATIAAKHLRDRLLHGPVQLRQGPHAGGVAGSWGEGDQPLYIYGEITGYYLHWLASLTEEDDYRKDAAQLAVDWLGRYLQHECPPTRVYLQQAPDDWRNQAMFAFDLAMVAGGYARCVQTGLIKADEALIGRLDVLLQNFVSTDWLRVMLVHGDVFVLPLRWSTHGGPFSAKTVSRILLLNKVMPLHQSLVQQCQRQLRYYTYQAATLPSEMLHPTLYSFEGMLLAQDINWESMALGLERVLRLQGDDGSMPEALDNQALRRNDVAAQALRMALMLEARLGDRKRFEYPIQKLAQWLCQQVGKDGKLPFAPGHGPNTWCTIFAEQALRLYVAREAGQSLPLTEADVV